MVDTWKPILDELMVVDELEAVISSSWTQFLPLMFWGWKKRKIDISKLSAFQAHCNGLCSPFANSPLHAQLSQPLPWTCKEFMLIYHVDMEYGSPTKIY